MTTASRILREKRALLVPLLFVAFANLAVYLLGVAPLRVRVDSVGQEAAKAREDVKTAADQLDEAQKTVTGKSRAAEQLRKFYEEVLPADLAAARRVTHLDLSRMARDASLRVQRRDQSQEQEKESTLVRLDTTMVLEGSYADLREFLYEVETAPDFVVIKDVALAQRQQDESDLVLTMSLATFFRADRGR
jgi:Tfp pilus assembly protein PilO